MHVIIKILLSSSSKCAYELGANYAIDLATILVNYIFYPSIFCVIVCHIVALSLSLKFFHDRDSCIKPRL